MAEIVLGLGTPHSPQLSTPPEMWEHHGERDRSNPELHAPDGKVYNYEQLLDMADPSLARELTLEKFQTRHAACQQAIATLSESLAKTAPDVLVIMGNDQLELFHEDNMPALLTYWGESLRNIPPKFSESTPPVRRASAWGWAGDKEVDYPVASDLSLYIIQYLMEHEFDVAHSRHLKEGQGMSHAFGFVYQRIMNGNVIPTVPIMINTYYPPNQVVPKRCYELGQAVRRAIESWDSDARVAVIASGGLSHFVIDEELDSQVLKGFENRDTETLFSLPREKLNSGNSEIRNWVAAAGAAEHLQAKTLDYVPCYRTPAGTGCGMGFVQWS
jgi:3-O-methylgallate 3,4-dioxygenase